jgi:hypothetical protein
MLGLLPLVRGAAFAALLGASLGCSQPASTPSAQEQGEATLVKAQRDREQPTAQLCLLDATDCLALDSRPFEPCLIATERCPRDAQLEWAHARVQR